MEALASQGQTFVARDQNQRAALAILAGNLYVAFGGHFGDCGQYRGFVVGIYLTDPRTIKSWATRARGGGIWAPGGISTDGRSLFVATGNTFGARTWSDGEAVIRLSPDLSNDADILHEILFLSSACSIREFPISMRYGCRHNSEYSNQNCRIAATAHSCTCPSWRDRPKLLSRKTGWGLV